MKTISFHLPQAAFGAAVFMAVLLVNPAFADLPAPDGPPEPTRTPLVRTVDLNLGETADVELADNSIAQVRLVAVEEHHDSIRNAVRKAVVTVEVNGETVNIQAGNYNLPVTVQGVQIDATATRGYYANSNRDNWALDTDARLRLWPGGSPWVEPGTFVYPIEQRWLASYTQVANEPTWVDGPENPNVQQIYYHDAFDFGGAEGRTRVVAATDALVVSAANTTLPGYDGTPVRPRYDVVYLLDDRGWYYRYSHLVAIDTRIRVGDRVPAGHPLGILGKEGHSGGWAHLHFGISSMQPSGRWGTQEAYAFVWQAYRERHDPEVAAVARPHHLARVGESVTLDGSRSWTADGKSPQFHWTFTDGSTANGAQTVRSYGEPGVYSEVLAVTDSEGNRDYDFAVVQVLDPEREQLPPALHPAHHPTQGIRPGQPIDFYVRVFSTSDGFETWDFGDGSPTVTTRSSDGKADPLDRHGYAHTVHAFRAPGHYIVRVQRSNENGETAIAHLHVVVDGQPEP